MEDDCREIVSVCKQNRVLLAVCHVLRYASWAQKIKEIIESGEIGEVVNIQHTEPVSRLTIKCRMASITRSLSFQESLTTFTRRTLGIFVDEICGSLS